jgi:hypothetical protein
MTEETEKLPPINRVDGIYICDLCLDGKGGICWSPGCIFWAKTAPDVPIRDYILDCGGIITR